MGDQLDYFHGSQNLLKRARDFANQQTKSPDESEKTKWKALVLGLVRVYMFARYDENNNSIISDWIEANWPDIVKGLGGSKVTWAHIKTNSTLVRADLHKARVKAVPAILRGAGKQRTSDINITEDYISQLLGKSFRQFRRFTPQPSISPIRPKHHRGITSQTLRRCPKAQRYQQGYHLGSSWRKRQPQASMVDRSSGGSDRLEIWRDGKTNKSRRADHPFLIDAGLRRLATLTSAHPFLDF